MGGDSTGSHSWQLRSLRRKGDFGLIWNKKTFNFSCSSIYTIHIWWIMNVKNTLFNLFFNIHFFIKLVKGLSFCMSCITLRLLVYDSKLSLHESEESWHNLATVSRFLMPNACLVLKAKRDTILTDLKHVLSTPWPICCVSLVNLMETKGGNF